MSKVIDRMLRRQKYPVKSGDEIITYIRALTHREDKAISEAAKIDPAAAGGLMFALAMLSDDGVLEFARVDGESDLDFGLRVLDMLQDVPGDMLALIGGAIKRLDIPPNMAGMEMLKKN